MSKKIAVYPGTFDPITFGHLDVIERAREIFDTVIVAVAQNSSKEPLFSDRERKKMIEEVVGKYRNVKVDSFRGMLVNYCRSKNATAIVRGLRAVSDFEYEFQMALMNRRMKPHIETIFLMTGAAHFYTAARLVKEIASFDGNVDGLVPPHVVKRLKEKFAKQKQP